MTRFFEKKSIILFVVSIFLICGQAFGSIIEADFIQALTLRACNSDIVTMGLNKNIKALYDMGVVNLSLSLVGIIFISMILGIFGVVLSSKAVSIYIANIRYMTYKKIQSFSYQDIDKFSPSSLITRTTTDAELISISFMFAAKFLTSGLFMFVFGLIKSIIDLPKYSIVYAGLLPFLVVFLGVVVWKSLPYFRDTQKNTDSVNAIVRETILGIRVVKAYNLENIQKDKLEVSNEKLAHSSMKAFSIVGILMPIIQAGINATMIIIYIIAYGQAGSGSFSEIIKFSSILMQVLFGFIISIVTFVQISRAIPSMKRVLEVNKFAPSLTFVDENDNKITKGEIEFKNVSYSFHNNEDSSILSNISLKINPKETIGIIGATGSGKSTLINLIARLFDPTSGQILIDGNDIREYSFDELNNNVSIAMQTATLFSGTIKTNIAMGLPLNLSKDELDKEVEKAAKAAEAWEFISKRNEKLDSVVEQRGKNYSGGQKQRISIARTIAKKSKIIIFDDSTSALDTVTERKVQSNIKKYNNATTIIVAQRISSVEELDKIIVLDKGKMVGFDSHWNLLANNEIYRSIAASQIGTEELNKMLKEKGVKLINEESKKTRK